MLGHLRGVVLLSLLLGACSGERSGNPEDVLVVALSAEPQTWNRLLAVDEPTHVVTEQLHAPLIRINPVSQQLEPALAQSWEFSEDGKSLTFHLRPGVRFSNGEPFTASDVEFTFRVLYDPSVGSQLADSLKVDGEPLEVEVIDDQTVCFRLPRRTAAIERPFDSIGILSRSSLEASFESGNLAAAMGLSAAPEEIAGLGPFKLDRFDPGERVVLTRNPYYWKNDGSQRAFPRIAALDFEIVPDPNAQLLRFRAQEIDLLESLSPEAFLALSADEPDQVKLIDLGPGMVIERLWFNLNPESPIPEHKKRWFGDPRFRRAVLMAIDREALAQVVFSGLASPAIGSVSIANRFWHNDAIVAVAHDPAASRALLSQVGFDWDGEGKLRDATGEEVVIQLVTNSETESRVRTAAFLREDLAEVGIDLVLHPVEVGDLVRRITASGDYEACLLGLDQTDPDPSAETGLWLSHAPLHFWYPSQDAPFTPWEARIDELMGQQMVTTDREQRKAYYDEIQVILAAERPLLDLVVPHTLIAVNERVDSLRPTPFRHSLWNSDELSLSEGEIPRRQFP